jgi:flagellar P-ring protein FlgI
MVMKYLKWMCMLMLLGVTLPSEAARIKDLAQVQGVRSNQLIGYGLVVGLPGTGEKNNAFSEQTFRTMLNNFGIKVPDNLKPKIKDVAPVAVHAELPAFSKPGQTIDITVSAIGEAKSLRGGTLLQTFLKGVDGRVYALAQGSLIVGGLGADGADGSKIVINTPTVGRIPNGASVEREVPNSFNNGDTITFNLNRSDFTTAKRMTDVINGLVGADTARALDATSVQVYAPRDPSQRVSYLATLENLQVDPADESAKIIVNSRTGTIVIGSQVTLKPAAITHGGLTVTISENPQVSQPNAFSNGQTTTVPNSTINVQQANSRMFKLDTGNTLDDLVQAINQVGVAPGDLMAILEALQQAGALQGELVIL